MAQHRLANAKNFRHLQCGDAEGKTGERRLQGYRKFESLRQEISVADGVHVHEREQRARDADADEHGIFPCARDDVIRDLE